jgi:hypothetical protein
VEGDAVAQVLDAVELLRRRAADHAVDLVALLEQQLGEVGAVLPGDAGDEAVGLIGRPTPPARRARSSPRAGLRAKRTIQGSRRPERLGSSHERLDEVSAGERRDLQRPGVRA